MSPVCVTLCFALLSSHVQVKPTHCLHTTTEKYVRRCAHTHLRLAGPRGCGSTSVSRLATVATLKKLRLCAPLMAPTPVWQVLCVNGRQTRLLEEEEEEEEEEGDAEGDAEGEEAQAGHRVMSAAIVLAGAGGADTDRHRDLSASYQGTVVTITISATVTRLSSAQQTAVGCFGYHPLSPRPLQLRLPPTCHSVLTHNATHCGTTSWSMR